MSESGRYALSPLGGALFYLRQAFLDKLLLRYAKYELLPCTGFKDVFEKPYMVLDAPTLENLEIFENSRNGDSTGTLYARINHCVTASGKRLLKAWLARPLYHSGLIKERQDVVASFKVLSAYEFEKHAGGAKSRHPNNHIHLENGRPIYSIIEELKNSPLGWLENVVKDIAGSAVNEFSFQAWKASTQQCDGLAQVENSYKSYTNMDTEEPYPTLAVRDVPKQETYSRPIGKGAKRRWRRPKSSAVKLCVPQKSGEKPGLERGSTSLLFILIFGIMTYIGCFSCLMDSQMELIWVIILKDRKYSMVSKEGTVYCVITATVRLAHHNLKLM